MERPVETFLLSCFPVFLLQFRVAAAVKSFDTTFRIRIFLIFVSFVYFASGLLSKLFWMRIDMMCLE